MPYYSVNGRIPVKFNEYPATIHDMMMKFNRENKKIQVKLQCNRDGYYLNFQGCDYMGEAGAVLFDGMIRNFGPFVLKGSYISTIYDNCESDIWVGSEKEFRMKESRAALEEIRALIPKLTTKDREKLIRGL